MKKKLLITAILIIIIFVVCFIFIKPTRSVAPVIDDVNTTPTPIPIYPTASISATTDELSPTPADYLSADTYRIEANTDYGKISIPLTDVPMIYDALTEGCDLNDPLDLSGISFQLSRISPSVVYSTADESYLLVNYNCGVKLCDYALLKHDGKNTQSLYINNGAYGEGKISPDHHLIAFLFAWPEGTEAIYHSVTLVDLTTMEIIPLELPKDYDYYVESYEWDLNMLTINYKNRNENEIITYVYEV